MQPQLGEKQTEIQNKPETRWETMWESSRHESNVGRFGEDEQVWVDYGLRQKDGKNCPNGIRVSNL